MKVMSDPPLSAMVAAASTVPSMTMVPASVSGLTAKDAVRVAVGEGRQQAGVVQAAESQRRLLPGR